MNRLKAIRVLKFPAKGIRRIARPLGHDQDRVAPAFHQLLDKLVSSQHAFHVILPAMEVDNEINLARLAEPFGNKDRHGTVRVMLGGGI